MKAAHRKELQTNSLADFLARIVRKARSGGGISWFTVFGVLIVLAVVLGFWWVMRNKAEQNAEAWAKVEYNDTKSLLELSGLVTSLLESKPYESKDSTQGQAASFTLGFGLLWDGIRFLGDDTKLAESVRRIDLASRIYTQLAEDCKDDHERLAEAKYHLAVANEALASLDAVTYLDKAGKGFEELTKGELAATPYGKLATKRMLPYMVSDESKTGETMDLPKYKAEMIVFYSKFRSPLPVFGPGQ